jgi:hypothetical protein
MQFVQRYSDLHNNVLQFRASFKAGPNRIPVDETWMKLQSSNQYASHCKYHWNANQDTYMVQVSHFNCLNRFSHALYGPPSTFQLSIVYNCPRSAPVFQLQLDNEECTLSDTFLSLRILWLLL